MKTLISSVAFQDEAGNALTNGSLILSLPSGVYLISSGGGQVIGQSFIINLDATGKVPASITIWASDEINPQTPYSVVLCAQPNGAQPVGTATWFIGGVSPIDLSLMTQTSTGISYSGAVLLNPTAQQTINGQTLNMEGASVGFSAAASTTPDSFLSRIGNGIIGIGTAIGNALGVLSVATIKQPSASSFALLDPLGVSHLFISSSSPYVNTFINGNGTGGVFLGSAAKANVLDTTGKITTAGGIALQTTSQTLPATISNDTLGGFLFTSNAGKGWQIANSTGQLQGFTGVNILLQGATSGSITLAVPAVAGSNTLTLPAATDTLVGKSTTDTLTNKTVGAGGLAGLTPNFQKFTSSGTFTIPAGITAVKATVVSGGGAGGGTSGAASNNGVGGSSGGSAVKFLSGLTPGNTLTVTIGAGGTGVSNATGNTGGASSITSGTQTITSILTNGGNGGLVAGQPLSGGAAGSGGDLNLGGSAGFVGSANNVGGNGANSIFGGGGTAGLQGAGNAATAFGSGGGGAGGNAGSASAGGAGASGIVIFEWVN